PPTSTPPALVAEGAPPPAAPGTTGAAPTPPVDTAGVAVNAEGSARAPAAAAAPPAPGAATGTTAGQAPAPAAVAPPGTEADAVFRAYTVQPGDTLRSVADRFGVSAASIARESGLANPDTLPVGHVLTIPTQPG